MDATNADTARHSLLGFTRRCLASCRFSTSRSASSRIERRPSCLPASSAAATSATSSSPASEMHCRQATPDEICSYTLLTRQPNARAYFSHDLPRITARPHAWLTICTRVRQEPFWPEGLGINRGFLHVLDCADMLCSYAALGGGGARAAAVQQQQQQQQQLQQQQAAVGEAIDAIVRRGQREER
eukprot:6185935-Pleurochrysis_carterae.AAC.2